MKFIKKAICLVLTITFFVTSLYAPDAHAQVFLPAAGMRVPLSSAFTPAIIRGMTIDPKNPFAFSFLVDQGDKPLHAGEQKDAYLKLIKYFMAAMTIAEDKQWVNLSPYEGKRIIDTDFGKTEMGRDLLGQDYILKQITASLLYPEDAIGKEFWQKVYREAAQKYGTTQIPVNTFNKVWIVPETASVYEKGNTVLVVNSKLKVMLEEDYLSTLKHQSIHPSEGTQSIARKVLSEIVIPALTKEVNEGANFANLRQIYHSMILATWYKQALKRSILTQIYANKGKVKGVDLSNPIQAQQQVYQQYLKAFKKGAYNFVKEEQDPLTGQIVPRKYFSGGFNRDNAVIVKADAAMTAQRIKAWGSLVIVTGSLIAAYHFIAPKPYASENIKSTQTHLNMRKGKTLDEYVHNLYLQSNDLNIALNNYGSQGISLSNASNLNIWYGWFESVILDYKNNLENSGDGFSIANTKESIAGLDSISAELTVLEGVSKDKTYINKVESLRDTLKRVKEQYESKLKSLSSPNKKSGENQVMMGKVEEFMNHVTVTPDGENTRISVRVSPDMAQKVLPILKENGTKFTYDNSQQMAQSPENEQYLAQAVQKFSKGHPGRKTDPAMMHSFEQMLEAIEVMPNSAINKYLQGRFSGKEREDLQRIFDEIRDKKNEKEFLNALWQSGYSEEEFDAVTAELAKKFTLSAKKYILIVVAASTITSVAKTFLERAGFHHEFWGYVASILIFFYIDSRTYHSKKNNVLRAYSNVAKDQETYDQIIEKIKEFCLSQKIEIPSFSARDREYGPTRQLLELTKDYIYYNLDRHRYMNENVQDQLIKLLDVSINKAINTNKVSFANIYIYKKLADILILHNKNIITKLELTDGALEALMRNNENPIVLYAFAHQIQLSAKQRGFKDLANQLDDILQHPYLKDAYESFGKEKVLQDKAPLTQDKAMRASINEFMKNVTVTRAGENTRFDIKVSPEVARALMPAFEAQGIKVKYDNAQLSFFVKAKSHITKEMLSIALFLLLDSGFLGSAFYIGIKERNAPPTEITVDGVTINKRDVFKYIDGKIYNVENIIESGKGSKKIEDVILSGPGKKIDTSSYYRLLLRPGSKLSSSSLVELKEDDKVVRDIRAVKYEFVGLMFGFLISVILTSFLWPSSTEYSDGFDYAFDPAMAGNKSHPTFIQKNQHVGERFGDRAQMASKDYGGSYIGPAMKAFIKNNVTSEFIGPDTKVKISNVDPAMAKEILVSLNDSGLTDISTYDHTKLYLVFKDQHIDKAMIIELMEIIIGAALLTIMHLNGIIKDKKFQEEVLGEYLTDPKIIEFLLEKLDVKLANVIRRDWDWEPIKKIDSMILVQVFDSLPINSPYYIKYTFILLKHNPLLIYPRVLNHYKEFFKSNASLDEKRQAYYAFKAIYIRVSNHGRYRSDLVTMVESALSDFDTIIKEDEAEQNSDKAQKSNYGGIDLNSANLNLNIKRDGNGVPLPLGDQDPAMLNAPGFVPVIISIKPAVNLPILAELRALASRSA